ncbi:MAG: hypothetical protein WEC14_10600 [Chloroflexota bacterium]
MGLSRRRILVAAAAVPVLFAVDRGIRAAGDGIRAAAASVRPPAVGTSASRCAMCGAPDHSMLNPGCPAARMLG